jgi:hypothetical protein
MENSKSQSRQYGSLDIVGGKDNEVIHMEIAKLIILLVYLLLVLLILSFNWLYSARTIRANKHIGLYTPEYIKQIVKVSNGLAIGTGVLIGAALVSGRF